MRHIACIALLLLSGCAHKSSITIECLNGREMRVVAPSYSYEEWLQINETGKEFIVVVQCLPETK